MITVEKIYKINEDAKKKGKKIHIRGFGAVGLELGKCLYALGIEFEGYYDYNAELVGKVDYRGTKCYSLKEENAECVVLCSIQSEIAKKEIVKEYAEKNVECFFVSKNEIDSMFQNMDDEKYLKEHYFMLMKEELNLENPQTLCEKIQWLKLYDRNPLYTKLADKYEVRKYVSDTIGEKYLVPNCGVWDSFSEIDFDKLPKQFVLKCTNNSGYCYVVKDKDNFDKEEARRILETGLASNYFYRNREWVYKDIKPRIIADVYIDSLGKPDSIEYKFHCYNGKVDHVEVERGINHSAVELLTLDAFDREFNPLDYTFKFQKSKIKLEKPLMWDKMLELSETLAGDIPNVRVDFYVDNEKILFSEMTFYTWAGYMHFEPAEWDKKLGDKLKLPQKVKQ